MKIEAVDFFYLAMPRIRDIGDGSQDALLVRVQAGGYTGWGECEASPLVSIANWVCPMSHSACKPLQSAVLGMPLNDPADIVAITRCAHAEGLDIAQTDHTLSGVDIALWDLLAKSRGVPVYELLGYRKAYPKTPYASQLFGDTPLQTLEKAKACRRQGYRAAKFGWGPYGHGDASADRDQIFAAREGLGPDAKLLIDAGTVWHDDVAQARLRLADLQDVRAYFLEEPFVSGALHAYASLAQDAHCPPLAGGEGAHNFFMARQMIDFAHVGFIQIDTGRIGGITTAKQVADYATSRGVPYINHTFTTPLALNASIQPFAGVECCALCEYPVEATPLATGLVTNPLMLNAAGEIELPAAPGLGMAINMETVRQYLVDVRIEVGGRVLYQTPDRSSIQ